MSIYFNEKTPLFLSKLITTSYIHNKGISPGDVKKLAFAIAPNGIKAKQFCLKVQEGSTHPRKLNECPLRKGAISKPES